MTKPMYCPMAFNGCIGVQAPLMPCTPDCAWAGKRQGRYFCTVPAKISEWTEEINSRPLKDDEE